MSERNSYPPGVPCWVDIAQPDPSAAMSFYRGLFGWEFSGPGETPDGGDYFVARLRGRDVAGVSTEPAQGAAVTPAWTTHVRVDNAAEAAEKAQRAGGSVVAGPFEALPAERLAVLADTAGAVFCVWEAEQREGAQLVNQAGAWSWSQLITHDPDGAKSFYTELFGWEPETFAMGDAEITLFRLPGYVGGEPTQPVSRDVVAGMAASDEDAAGWSVDFWIADTSEAVSTAERLGGGVLVPPYETPITTQAVLADPWGASFSVSKVPGT